MPHFKHEGHRLSYAEFGEGPRAVVLLHGLLLSKRMHEPLAEALAERGNRVITFDLLGHGDSDRPRDMWKYSIPKFAEQTVALLDHLGIDEAVVGGTSLGANTTLEVANCAPERLRGMWIEMPALDNALLACAVAFTPLTLALTFGEGAMSLLAAGLRRIPSAIVPFWPDVLLDTMRQEPGPSGAMMQGVLFGRVAPSRSKYSSMNVPALVFGHHRDPIHPFSDAGMLASELPDVRFLEANSAVELRIKPGRLTDEIGDFVDECWKPKRVKPKSTKPRARKPAAASKRAATRA